MINQLKLNLACGQVPWTGFYNIDKVAMDGVDAVMDLLDFPWDIESESAERIVCEHFVEHIPHDLIPRYLLKYRWDDRRLIPEPDTRDGLIQFIDEVYRILKPEGYIDIVTPFYSSETMWRDPTHCRVITDNTFHYFNKKWRDNSGLSHYGILSNFEVVLHSYEFYSDMLTKTEEQKAKGVRFNNNVIANITTRLTKI